MRSEWMNFLHTQLAPADAADAPARENDRPTEANLICPINDLAILTVSGRDAERFLQGQTTCDTSQLGADAFGLGAICNPKGRAVATFRMFRADEDFYLLVAMELLPALQKRLQMYVLRADVRLGNETEDWCCLGVIGDQASAALAKQGIDPPVQLHRLSRKGDCITVKMPASSDRYLILAGVETAKRLWTGVSALDGFAAATQSAWDREEIAQGLPSITAATSEEFVPQMLNLDRLGGIDFEKGCYTGQEVVARMHYLGNLKRRMYRIRCKGSVMPKPGDRLYAANSEEGQSIGRIVAVAPALSGGYEMLAVIEIRHAESGDIRLFGTQGKAVERLPLPYSL